MRKSIHGMAASIAAALILSHDINVRFDEIDERPKPSKEPTKYRAPQPNHAEHIARAEAKRARKAAKLRGE